jgi:alkylation response protein AidB-like acyl-CoA dehydrogenase
MTADGVAAFRTEVATWFGQNKPTITHRELQAMDAVEFLDFQRSWLTRLNTVGFAAPHVPVEFGGAGLDPQRQAIVHEEWARAEAPLVSAFEISLYHLPGTMLGAGRPEQIDAYVRQAIEGVIWCQGFSEPSAGSDLAALRTRATRSGGDWVVSGQKIWSSHADVADHCLLLARTDPDSAKHAGISYFVLDMDQPGVTVVPIRQVTGQAEFCEIFLDEARIPARNIIGEPGDGWRIAQSTLTSERTALTVATIERIGVALTRLRDELLGSGVGARHELTQIEAQLAELMSRQLAARSLVGDVIGLIRDERAAAGLASVLKLTFSQLLQDVMAFAVQARGQQSLATEAAPNFVGYVSGDWPVDWLQSWGWTISAGTNEIQRTIIAERLLGMPREPAQQVRA